MEEQRPIVKCINCARSDLPDFSDAVCFCTVRRKRFDTFQSRHCSSFQPFSTSTFKPCLDESGCSSGAGYSTEEVP